MVSWALLSCAAVVCTQAMEVAHWEIGTHKQPDSAAGFHLTVWAPKTKTKTPPPTLLFVTGFGAKVEASAYSEVLGLIAANNFIVVGADLHSSGSPDYPALGQVLGNTTVPFLSTSIFVDTFAAHGVIATPDVATSLAIGGHSAGNHIAVQSVVDGCGPVKAVVMVDPV